MRWGFVWSNNHWDDNLYFITKPLLKSMSFPFEYLEIVYKYLNGDRSWKLELSGGARLP